MQKLKPFNDLMAALLSCCFWGVIVAVVLCIGACEDQVLEPSQNETGESVSRCTPANGVIPFESEDPASGEIYTGFIYTHESQVGYDRLTGSLAEDRLLLEAQGFSFSLSRSKYIATSMSYEGRQTSVDILVLTFEECPPNPLDRSYVILRNTRISGVNESFQVEKLFHGADPWVCWTSDGSSSVAFLGLHDGTPTWSQSFCPVVANPYASDGGARLAPQMPVDSMPDGGPDAWDWVAFLECTATEAAVGCGVAAGVCLTGNDPYSDCVESGCASAAVGAVISCSAQQLW